MSQLGDTLDRLILDCPCCATKVAVPAAAQGAMAKCVRCDGTFRIPPADDQVPLDESQADDLAIRVLEEASQDETTTALQTVEDEHEDQEDPEDQDGDQTRPMSILERIDAETDEDPPDIGDDETPDQVKELRRERHRLLLEVGQEAHHQILPSAFDEFQTRIRKVQKRARRLRAWLEAVDRASSEDNPLARRVDMNVDPTKAARQLVAAERDVKHTLRVLAEALVATEQLPTFCAEQRERIKDIDAELDELVPPPPKKKGLLSRFRNE